MENISTQSLVDAATAIKMHQKTPGNKIFAESAYASIGGIIIGEAMPFMDKFNTGEKECLSIWLKAIEALLFKRIGL